MTIRISNRQHALLEAFVERKHLTIAQAQGYDQRAFRSLMVREWIVYRTGRGFVLTAAGTDAWNEFLDTDIARTNPRLPLTAYFDPTAYGLTDPYRRGLHLVKSRAA